MKPQFIIHIIARINEQFNKKIIQELNSNNINNLAPSHGEILYVLSLNRKLTMRDLAILINRTKPTVTILTRKLENAGYIRKVENENDARSFHVELTKKGKNLIPIMQTISEKIIKEIFAGINDQQISSGMEFLSRIKSNLY